jgi:hypothetical protein
MERLGLIDPTSDTNSSCSSSDLGPAEIELNHLLSFASETPLPAQGHQADAPFTKIGAGACGAVFAQQGKPYAIKLSKTSDHGALWNDYIRHAEIARHFGLWEFDEVAIPACHFFVPPDDGPQFLDQHPGLANAAEPVVNFLLTSALITERIPPLPSRVGALLINKYCAEAIKAQSHADPANRDCLVRVYLGSMQGRSGQRFFALRNFKMHLNHMLELQLDVRALARRVGAAMALMHWAAKTDARDVEFVLGGAERTTSLAVDPERLSSVTPGLYTGPASRRTEDFFHRVVTTKLWVLDFNQVRQVTMDSAGVAQMVEAARVNDPYIPKPLQASADEREVWRAFALVCQP